MFIQSADLRVSIHSLLFQPEYYLFDFDPQSGMTRFLIVGEDIQDKVPFVDIRLERLAQASFSVPTRDLFSLEGQHDHERPPIHYIFHHAFVCSTLLARCLNQIDEFFSLKEPWILRRLADVKRRPSPPLSQNQWREMFRKYNALLSKNFSTGRTTVVKATNVAGNLVIDVLKLMPESRILYLYSDLQSFLISNQKKTTETQQKMSALYGSFSRDSDFAKRFDQLADPCKFSFLEICALIWVTNIYNLHTVLEQHPTDAVATLSMRSLLSEPAKYLAKTSSHFRHVPSQDELDLMTHDSVMQWNAKDPRQQYGSASRERESEQILERHQADIDAVLKWIAPVITDLGLEEFLQRRTV